MRKVVNIVCYLLAAFHVAKAIYCTIQGGPREATICAYFGFSLWLITRNWNEIFELREQNRFLKRFNQLMMEELTKDGDFECDRFRIEKRLIDQEGCVGEDQMGYRCLQVGPGDF